MKISFVQNLSGYAIYFCSFLLTVVRYRQRNRRFRKDLVRNILVIKLEHIGDVILTIPTLAVLREHFPGAKITMMVGSWARPILEDDRLIDNIVVYDSERYVRGPGGGMDSIERKHVFSGLNKASFDLVVSLSDDWKTLWFLLSCRCRYRVDMGSVRVKRKLALMLPRLFRRYQDLAFKKHAAEMNLEVLKAIGLKGKTSKPSLPVGQAERERVEALLKEHGVQRDDLKVIVHPGAEWRYRAWGVERFARTADHLIRKYAATVLITGSENEVPLADEMIRRMVQKAVNLAGKTSLKELVALMKICHLFVGNDGGPMHMAAAIGTPVVALFGPQDPGLFGPLGEEHCVLYKGGGCSPCRQDVCVKEEGERCMELITVEEVTDCIGTVLKRREAFRENPRL